MVAVHSIEGLIKWVRRDEWRGAFEDVFQRHVGQACRGAGIELDELAEIVGDHGVSNLWGCAFEDFVSSGPDERNVATDYLQRRGWKESAGTRAYVDALRRSTMSLYEVSDIVVGESFLARDMIRGGEPVRVFERSATRSLKQWDRIAARIVTVMGKTQITGALLAFDHRLADEALASIERVRKKARAEALKLARSLGRATDEAALAPITGVDEVLAGAAFMFSALWLDDVLRRALNPTLPEMQNTDGESLEFITLHFPLLSKAKLPAILSALDALPALSKESDSFWNWLETGKKTGKVPARKARSVQTFSTTMDNGATVLGNVEISGKAVTLSVNSQGRATRGQAMLEAALGGLVRAPLLERQTVEQMMAASPRRSARNSEPPPLPPNELKRVVHQGLTDHYRRTLDEPIPVLGNRSPRQAAKTAKGRDKVISWLKMLESGSGRQDPDDPMASYDFTWLWEELGVAEQRQ
ncbi:MAG: hypothetical protein ING31_10180 [Burkholderiales bacterium]|nr:hypothetical protein [Burkholderiales bacterium]MCA3611765.1 hypothetical protein [Methylobacterium sp.]